MKKSEIIWIVIITITLLSLIITSGIFYFSMVSKSMTTGHVILADEGANVKEEQEEIPPIEGKVVYSEEQLIDYATSP